MLKRLRTEHNYQQKDIAEFLNIRQSAYSMIESGQRGLSIDFAKKLGELYSINWWLFFESEDQSA